MMTGGSARGVRQWIELALALLLLDASLTFQNIWPTPAIRWNGGVSVELAVCLLMLAIAMKWRPLSRRAVGWLAAAWAVLVVGRYAAVTAPALYGREINLYWDVRYLPAVTAMLTRVASLWLIALVLAVLISIPAIVFAAARWSLGRVNDAMYSPIVRRTLILAAGAVILLFAARPADERLRSWLPSPVSATYARQVRLLTTGLTGYGRRALPAGPAMDSDLTRVAGADVLLIFIESYGAVSYDRPEFTTGLATARQRLAADIHATGREVVSAYVESPTFGGGSWFAHISLLSGIEVRDEDTDALLMAQKRDTLVSAFAHGGYRTVAIMPGLQQSWPEGVFYGFNEIYGEVQLDYRGPPFGWWTIPDQFTIARMDALEVSRRSRPPLFVFFPTTSTHTPFSPVAPYQPDWPRVLTDHPYDEHDVERAWNEVPDWTDFGPSYVRAVSYFYQSIGGYLRMRADRDFVIILIGDHQPPAAVSGEGASWEVPVHVIASRGEVLGRLRSRGFLSGLTPQHPALARMHHLVPILLEAFGGRQKG
ncbi:MAG: hypothetical protein C5B57_04025 [Blastocatellia bacterium]|nr:MAG: hypothetical protein C5B57_04025 [Blastocatellia bacterium]